MDFLPKALQALGNFNQFIVYVLSPSKTRVGKTDKFPIDFRNGQIANAHDPNIWLSAPFAIACAKGFGANYGVGFVFTESDPFWFLDIDDCLDANTNDWSATAKNLVAAFPGAAVEVSSSGRGLHIIGSGQSPSHSCKNAALKLEFYTTGRFVALTGTYAQGDAALDCSVVLPWLVDNYFIQKTNSNQTDWTDHPCEGWKGNTDDHELISRALRSQSSRSVFGGGIAFKDLWEANVEALARAYPDPNRECGYDESAADAGLAQRLAFWTGNDCERMKRLMLQSALSRDKWNREDYLPRTILGACGRQLEWLNDKSPQDIVKSEQTQGQKPRASRVTGTTFLNIEQQQDIFEGCVYIADDHKILVPGGYTLNPERFKVMYGGYSMPMDIGNERVTRNAWEAFTESQALRHPRADTSCFKPDLAPGEVIIKDGQRLANIYWPVTTPRVQGDPSRFLWHIEKLFPDPTDQAIILSYLAALIQHKGVKFQWAPLIQGVEGNGKTFFTRCIAYAIGDRYSHFPKAAEIASKFNDWLYAKIFIGVEDIYVHDSKYEVMETLKPMLTSERQEIEPKGGAKLTRDICANFLINTNHKDGLRKTQNDRRFAPFYTAQQSVADLKRDRMLGEYFPELYNWAIRTQGFAIIADYLENYAIPYSLNPATGCKRAPITSSTEAAIEHGMGGIELEIQEAMEQGVPGFKNGWVSSMALDKLLIRLHAGRRIPINKRRELMQSLGYDIHPNLKEGRTTGIVQPDGGKPRLYIKMDHKDNNLMGASEIAKAYSEAQK
jgi:hypothetical protein